MPRGPSKHTSRRRLPSGGLAHSPCACSSTLSAWTSRRSRGASMGPRFPLCQVGPLTLPHPSPLLGMKGCKSPLRRHFEGWFATCVSDLPRGLGAQHHSPAPSWPLCAPSAALKRGGGGGQGGPGWQVPTAWGSRVQTGRCGLASQGVGQEVLQVCGVGWGCLL